MKRGKVRIITADVGRLRQFYELVIKLEPVGDERYVEFRLPGLTLAIADQRRINMSAAGAATPAPTDRPCSTSKWKTWTRSMTACGPSLTRSNWCRPPSHGATVPCCFAIPMAILSTSSRLCTSRR